MQQLEQKHSAECQRSKRLKESNVELKTHRDNAETERKRLNDKIAELEVEAETYKHRLAEKQNESRDTERELRNRIVELEKRPPSAGSAAPSDLETKYQRAQQDMERKNALIRQLKEELERAVAQLEQQQQRMSGDSGELQQQLDRLRGERDELAQRLARTMSGGDAAQKSEYESLLSRYHTIRDALEEQKERVQELTEENADLKSFVCVCVCVFV